MCMCVYVTSVLVNSLFHLMKLKTRERLNKLLEARKGVLHAKCCSNARWICGGNTPMHISFDSPFGENN